MYASSYGFLAVFAAGAPLRRVERTAPSPVPDDAIRQGSKQQRGQPFGDGSQNIAPAYMAEAVLNFNVQLERFAKVGMVVIVGSMLSVELLSLRHLTWVFLCSSLFAPLPCISAYGTLASRHWNEC